MKNVLVVVFSILIAGQAFAAGPVKEFYVSSEGKPGNEGSNRRPFATLGEAREAVREYKSMGKPEDIIVWLNHGTYELSDCFELTVEDSGSPEATVTYRSLPGGKAVLSGGRTISPKDVQTVSNRPEKNRFADQAAINNIRVIDLAALGIYDYGENRITGFRRPYVNAALELFINGRPFHLSRYPNDTMIKLTPEDIVNDGGVENKFHTGAIRFDKDRLAMWSSAQDIIACGNFKYAWATDQLRVESIDPESGEVKFADAHMFGFTGDHEWNQYYYFNILEELDAPGEYYVDHNKGLLWFYPFEEIKPTDDIVVSILERPIVSLKGADYITFKDIDFQAGRGIGIYMENSISNKIENCNIRNMGVVGVCVGKGSLPATIYGHPHEARRIMPAGKLSEGLGSLYDLLYEDTVFDRDGGKNNGIINCVIENTGCGGISLGGGNRLTLEKAGNYIDNCEFTNCGRRDYSYKSPVNIDGVGNHLKNSQFNPCEATAIYIHGNDHIVEYNVVDGACGFMDDQGAIYLGRDPSEYGNIIRYNLLKNIGRIATTAGVYLDDGACGTQIYGNVFCKAGTLNILVGGGQFNKIENNVFIDANTAVHLDNRFDGWASNSIKPDGIFETRLKAMNYRQAPFARAHPEMTDYFEADPAVPKYNDTKNNIFIRVKQVHTGKKEWGPIHDANLVTDQDVDFRQLDALIREALPGFKPIPMDKIGRRIR